MSSPYKRRRPSLVRNFWVYRRLIGLAMILGLMLWFVVINNTEVTVFFPFRLGQITSTSGVIMLLSAFAGAIVAALIIGLILAIRGTRTQAPPAQAKPAEPADSEEIDDRPPPDYGSKTTEGFTNAKWFSE